MTRDEVLEWLNYRIQTKNIQDEDIIFIMKYIDHYTKEYVEPKKIAEAIMNRQSKGLNQSIINIIDSMINKLILDFDINMETHPTSNVTMIFDGFMGNKTQFQQDQIIKYF